MPKSKKPSSTSTFNHAMIYSRNVASALHFYRDILAFKLIEEFAWEGRPVYARLRSPQGQATIALHQAEPGQSVASDGIRLYLEVKALDRLCENLKAQGVEITQMPKLMPWGWRHAYLNDPDGHELSLYWAGRKRMQKTASRRAAGK